MSLDLNELTQKLSRVAETYSKRFGIELTPDWQLLKLQEEVGELSSAYLKITSRGRRQERTDAELKKNLQDEIADVLAMTLLFAHDQGIDAEQAFREKWFLHLPESER